MQILDTKKRIKIFREFPLPVEISANTLSMMDKSVDSLKAGIVSEPVDLSDFSGE